MKTFIVFRIPLLLFFLGGGLTYLFCVFFITPKYQSETTIFTANTHANIHLVSAGIRFGYDKEIGEQMEMLNSSAVREAIIEEFDLISVYEIDTNQAYWYEQLQNSYDKNITAERTINKSIVVSVLDVDPRRAAKMANRIVELADMHKSEIVLSNVRLAAASAKKSYEEKSELITLMTDSLQALRDAGESVWTFGEERKSGKYTNYELQYRRELSRYMDLKMHWEELEDLLNSEIPKSYVVSKAMPSSKPATPKKALLSLLAGAVASLGYLAFVKLKSADFS